MLNKVLSLIPGHLLKDSRSSSPARSPKGLQTTPAAPEAVKGTDSNHAASTAAKHAQQQLSGAQDPAPINNGATAATNGATAATNGAKAPSVRAVSVMWQDQQQQVPEEQQLTGRTDDPEDSSAAANGCNVARPVPSVPPLAPGTGVMRTSSDGSACNSRRASRLSDAGRASSRTSLPNTRSLDTTTEPNGQQQPQLQQPPARHAMSQLPLHLLPGFYGSSTPPSVASQTSSPEPFQQQSQQSLAQQPFWQGSNWSFGSHCEQNKRQHMEDRYVAADLTDNAAFSPSAHRAGFFAVYDGHSGHEAAEYLESHLQAYVLAAGPEALAADPLLVLSTAVQKAESEILASYEAGHGSASAGSTLLAILLVDDKLHVAHVGDSRAVLGRGAEPIQLTRDHKPACCIEAARIEQDDPSADISVDGYMYGELAVARAIGSAAWKRDPSRRALIPTPELVSIQLQPDDDFVVIATDGLWDKVDNTQAVAAARRALSRSRDAETAAKALVERAQRMESTDNITVVTLLLHGRAIAMPKSNSMLFKRSAALSSAIAAATGGADSPPGCSTPCSGASTPASGATPRCCTPSRGPSLTGCSSAPAAAVAAAAAAAMGPQHSLPPPLPLRPQE